MTNPARTIQIGVRIRPELRAALEAEAARQDRTISWVAIQWMEAGRLKLQGPATPAERLAVAAEKIRELRLEIDRHSAVRAKWMGY